jgi:hypothetical protein
MDIRRKLALLVTIVFYSFVLMIPALMPAREVIDPLAPIGPLARLDNPPPGDETLMLPLRQEASTALSELQAASASHP